MTSVVAAEGFDESTVLSFVASLERSSEHPLAAAVLAAAVARRLALLDVADFASFTGKGVTGVIGARRVAVGNTALLDQLGVAGAVLNTRADALRQQGATVLFVAVTTRWQASLRWPIRSRRRRWRRSKRYAARESAS